MNVRHHSAKYNKRRRRRRKRRCQLVLVSQSISQRANNHFTYFIRKLSKNNKKNLKFICLLLLHYLSKNNKFLSECHNFSFLCLFYFFLFCLGFWVVVGCCCQIIRATPALVDVMRRGREDGWVEENYLNLNFFN
jgi:hypothetical protein